VSPKNFFAQLKRRNVYKVAIAYGVVAWLLMQIASQIFPFFEIPNWAVRLVILLLIIGFPIAVIIAWAFELTPEGLKRTEVADAAPPPRSPHRAWIYVVVIGGTISIALFFLGRYTAGNKTTAASTDGISNKSVAVLPFENRSEDKANAYFADGIQDEILTRLSRCCHPSMRAATSQQLFSQRSLSVKRRGRQPKPRSLFSPIWARPYGPRDITTTPA